MSTDETKTSFEAMSIALHGVTKMVKDANESEEITPGMLASAIKLASLSNSHQEQLTSATVNAAIKLASKISNQDDEQQQQESLTPELLARALKLVTKTSNEINDNTTADQILATMKATITMSQINENNEFITSELLSDALKLAKE